MAQSSRMATASYRLTMLSMGLLIIPPLAAGMSIIPPIAALAGFALSALLALVVVVIAALFTRRQPNRRSRKEMSVCSVLALIPLTLLAMNVFLRGDVPPIHDISTDRSDPPQFIVAPSMRSASDNQFDYSPQIATQQAEAYPDLSTEIVALPPTETLGLAREVAESMDWEVYSWRPETGHFEAVDTTFWMGFKDDVVVRVQAASTPGTTQMDLRSASRVGVSDLGANADRIRSFLEAFREALRERSES